MHLNINTAQVLTLGITAASKAAYVYGYRRGIRSISQFFSKVILFYAFLQRLLLIFLAFNHVSFPLNLEAMESTVRVHVKHLLSGQPIYSEPSSQYIALAYMPLYYMLAVPFTWIFGANLFSLHLVAILGMFGSALIMLLTVRRATASRWWGLIAVGLSLPPIVRWTPISITPMPIRGCSSVSCSVAI